MFTYVRNFIFIGLASVIVLLSLAGCTELREYKKQVEAITVEDIDPAKVADGEKRRLRRGFRKTRQAGSHAAAAVSAR